MPRDDDDIGFGIVLFIALLAIEILLRGCGGGVGGRFDDWRHDDEDQWIETIDK